MADGEWTKKETNKALAAVSSLKRAIGVPNHPTKKDEFGEIQNNRIHIYVPDMESAELIGELLFKYGNGKRASYYDAHPEITSLRDTIRIQPLPEGGFDASMAIFNPRRFAESLSKMAHNHISPDSSLSR